MGKYLDDFLCETQCEEYYGDDQYEGDITIDDWGIPDDHEEYDD